MFTLFVVPGHLETGQHIAYRKIKRLGKKHKMEVRVAKIPWTSGPGSFATWNKAFLKQFSKPRNGKVAVLGFSFGAVIALLTAKETHPDQLILCSLSPYFLEDQRYLKPQWLRWWRAHMRDSDFDFASIARSLRISTKILVGKREGLNSLRRAKSAARQIHKASLQIIPAAGHNIGGTAYLKALDSVFAHLSSSNSEA